MIEKLRKRFFRISMIAMTAAMILVTAAINVINWLNVRSEMTETLSMLAENEGRPLETKDSRFEGRNIHQRNRMSESSFFAASWSGEKGAALLGPIRLDTINETEAMALVEQAAARGNENGRIGDYLYVRSEDQLGRVHYVFLNGETRLSEVRNLVYFSLAACIAGILLAMLAVSRFSRRAIEPILKNEKQQKQFITDASHELKTPLTVISANMDVLSMDVPGNTWIRSTQKQVAQMRRLVDELVYLSRLEESDRIMETAKVDINPLLEEVAEPFAAMAEFQGKKMEIQAEKDLTVQGNAAAIQRMISTLCDNAVKYAAEEGSILIRAEKEGRQVALRFSNTVETALTKEQCERLFQRFYRADESRSKGSKSGFGIGLSIAAAIAEKHGGSIGAEMVGTDRLEITCRLPGM